MVRVLMIQNCSVWRPLVGPVVDWPLALMDYRSVSVEDVHPTDLWKGEYELRGQTVSITHNPAQQWWYLGEHQTDEITVIKIWDSSKSASTKCTSHISPDTD